MNAGPWFEYTEHDNTIRSYECTNCKKASGRMYKRFVTEGETTHKEYKIVCSFCGRNTGAHLRKTLARKVWNPDGE